MNKTGVDFNFKKHFQQMFKGRDNISTNPSGEFMAELIREHAKQRCTRHKDKAYEIIIKTCRLEKNYVFSQINRYEKMGKDMA
jgi:hypothetical protein